MTAQDKQIKEIINSIETFCLGDIKYNRDKPIAAFMLCICCIDTLGALGCNGGRSNTRFEWFIKRFMKDYKGRDIYNRCRNNVIHSYSSKKRYSIGNDKNYPYLYAYVGDTLRINTDYFINNLVKGFKEMKKELLRLKSDIRKNAIDWDTENPILREDN
ncbi:MAG TPA: hypothetical protein VHB70_06740 [Parafilimonas sp.]|nr:hypothetical protein [Parafilimonas sp.]